MNDFFRRAGVATLSVRELFDFTVVRQKCCAGRGCAWLGGAGWALRRSVRRVCSRRRLGSLAPLLAARRPPNPYT